MPRRCTAIHYLRPRVILRADIRHHFVYFAYGAYAAYIFDASRILAARETMPISVLAHQPVSASPDAQLLFINYFHARPGEMMLIYR